MSFPSIPDSAFEDLVEEIKRFQDGLSDDHEIGVITDGGGSPIHIENLRMSGQMVVFEGTDGEHRVTRLIQHYTQMTVQMVVVPKLASEARRIGF